MYSYQEALINTIEELYENVSQEEIFKLVFKSYPIMDRVYTSPFRIDNTPSCYFNWYNEKLYFVDWASDTKHRSCIQAVIDYFKLSSIGEAITFVQENINSFVKKPEYNVTSVTKQKKQKEVTTIVPIRRNFEQKDILYWKRFGITQEQLMGDHVFPVSAVNLYKKDNWKRINFYDVAYCYELDLDIYKIYRPFQTGRYKWMSNINQNTIGNINDLDFKSDTLIITKSYKDCRVLRNLGYESIWFQNEGVIPSEFLLVYLINKYKRIVILYDNDNAGRIAAEKLMHALTLFDESKTIEVIESPLWYIKDIAEMYCYKGKDYTVSFLKQTLSQLNKQLL